MVRIILLFMLSCAGCTSVRVLEIPREASWDSPAASFALLCWAISHDQPVLVYRSLAPALKARYEKELGIAVRLDTFLDAWEYSLKSRWQNLSRAVLLSVECRNDLYYCRFAVDKRKGSCRFRNYPYFEIRTAGGVVSDGYLESFSLQAEPGKGWNLPCSSPPPSLDNDPPVRFTAGECWMLDEEPQWEP